MSKSAVSVLVTGDVVLDHHLYGGVNPSGTTAEAPGSEQTRHLGGAMLSCKMLEAAAKAEIRTWEQRVKEWENDSDKRNREIQWCQKENGEARQTGGSEKPVPESPKRPDSLANDPPPPSHGVDLGLETLGLDESLPNHLHSFGVWTPHPGAEKGHQVWRVEQNFGYGPAGPSKPLSIRSTLDSVTRPSVILLDDGAIHFRHQAAKDLWPQAFIEGSDGDPEPPWIILKMTAPLCRGDLWSWLLKRTKVARRLVVLVRAEDLRREDVLIRRRLSWEQTASDALTGVNEHPIGRELLQAAHVVVNFDSEGALWLHRDAGGTQHKAELFFDAGSLEGDHARQIKGDVYGKQNCLAVALAHHLCLGVAQDASNPLRIAQGICSGLETRRLLYDLGHGSVGEKNPGFPMEQIGGCLAATTTRFSRVTVKDSHTAANCPQSWTILAASESSITTENEPFLGLALLAAKFGRGALAHVPSFSRGKLFTVDRGEIESLRTLEGLIRDYHEGGPQKKPLSLGVFGPPGAGKSFGVRALAEAVLGDKAPFLEFNLSQFKSPADLIGPFHRIRDAALSGATPVAFWDEFDSKGYEWLQYLLAPMQDGAFQEGEITHPIGKCVFIFAGGTAATLAKFGPPAPRDLTSAERQALQGREREDRLVEEAAWHQFKLRKGPDFISRLHGHLDVLGPNPRPNPDSNSQSCPPDQTYPIRRALMLRGVLGLKEDAKRPRELDMDTGLLLTLLKVPAYAHGSRSFEKILMALAKDGQGGHYHRSNLPPDPLLDRETDAAVFHQIMNEHTALQDRIERFASAFHERYRNQAKEKGWPVKPEVDRPYADLSPEYQAANLAAARRVPDHLLLVDHVIVEAESGDRDSWQAGLRDVLEKHLERLARAEHQGWCVERIATGWSYAKERNDAQKHHPSLIHWEALSASDQEKDRTNIRAIPDILRMAGCKAVSASKGGNR